MCQSGVAVHLPDVFGWFHMLTVLWHENWKCVRALARLHTRMVWASVKHSNRFQFVFVSIFCSFHHRLHLNVLRWPIKISRTNNFDELTRTEKSDVLEMKCTSRTCLAVSYSSVNSNYYNFEMPIDQIAINLLKIWLAWHRSEKCWCLMHQQKAFSSG